MAAAASAAVKRSRRSTHPRHARTPAPCLQVLKQKRLYESQRDQLYNQQFNVEQTSFAMTSMQVCALRLGCRTKTTRLPVCQLRCHPVCCGGTGWC